MKITIISACPVSVVVVDAANAIWWNWRRWVWDSSFDNAAHQIPLLLMEPSPSPFATTRFAEIGTVLTDYRDAVALLCSVDYDGNLISVMDVWTPYGWGEVNQSRRVQGVFS